MEFFNYGFSVNIEKTPEEELTRIHRLLVELESMWNITALEIAGSIHLYRQMTHADEREEIDYEG